MRLRGSHFAAYHPHPITPPSGTPSAWITIRGEEDHRPVLAGRDNLLTAVNLSGVQYVRVENLEITHDDTAAQTSPRWAQETSAATRALCARPGARRGITTCRRAARQSTTSG